MHELGIVFEIVRQVTEAMEGEEGVVKQIILDVGEMSGVVPRYLTECFPAAVDGTALEKTELDINEIPANVRCKSCKKIYHLPSHLEACPFCGELHKVMISGSDLVIKEIVVEQRQV